MELKKKCGRLTEIARSGPTEHAVRNNPRSGPSNQPSEGDAGLDMLRQVQMAMAMSDMETRARER